MTTLDLYSAEYIERQYAYAADLERTSVAYITAADAPGLRKDAARYLAAESMRLHSESGLVVDRADNLSLGADWLREHAQTDGRHYGLVGGIDVPTSADTHCPICRELAQKRLYSAR